MTTIKIQFHLKKGYRHKYTFSVSPHHRASASVFFIHFTIHPTPCFSR